jgi:L-alanine-DL-glutamate epimerase-like enolase superfamily enzyme
MQRKSFVITAALVMGLALGIVLSPMVRGSNASAQTQPPAQAAAPANSLWNSFLDKLAGALNIQRSALDSAITSAGNSTADEAVQQGTLTQAQADALKARIQAGDIGALRGGRGDKLGGPHMGGAVQQAALDAAAKALNITSAELLTQLHSGQSLAQIAQAHNTTEQAVTTAALAAAKTQLDQQVTAGTLTQAQADAFYAHLQQQGAQLLTPRGRGRGGPRGAHIGGAVQQAALDAAAKALNITSAELLTQLRSGQPLAQIAQAHNTTEQAVTTAALAAAKIQLDQQVTAGTLTQAQADAFYAHLQQQGAQLLIPRGRGFKPGVPTTPQTPQAPTASPGTTM